MLHEARELGIIGLGAIELGLCHARGIAPYWQPYHVDLAGGPLGAGESTIGVQVGANMPAISGAIVDAHWTVRVLQSHSHTTDTVGRVCQWYIFGTKMGNSHAGIWSPIRPCLCRCQQGVKEADSR